MGPRRVRGWWNPFVIGCGRIGFHDRDASVADALTCPTGYEMHGAGCYRISASVQISSGAEADCEMDGSAAHLVVPDSSAELALLHALVDTNHWVGVTDRVQQGTYVEVTGGPKRLGLISGNAAAEDCLVVDGVGDQDDRPCDVFHRYICEVDGTPPDPAAF